MSIAPKNSSDARSPPARQLSSTALLKALSQLGQKFHDGTLSHQAYRHAFLRLLLGYLQCSRVSLWRFAGNGHAPHLVCRSSVEAIGTDRMIGAELTRAQYGNHVVRIVKLGVFVCPDTLAESTSMARRESYLVPQNVRAFLDVSCDINGRLYGVMRCEQFAEARQWTQAEATTVLRFSRLSSLQVARVLSGTLNEPALSPKAIAADWELE